MCQIFLAATTSSAVLSLVTKGFPAVGNSGQRASLARGPAPRKSTAVDIRGVLSLNEKAGNVVPFQPGESVFLPYVGGALIFVGAFLAAKKELYLFAGL